MRSFIGDYEVNRKVYAPRVSRQFLGEPGTGRRDKPYVELSFPHPGVGGKLRKWIWAPRTITARLDTGSDFTALTEKGAKMLGVGLVFYDRRSVRFMRLADGSVFAGVFFQFDMGVNGVPFENVAILFSLPADAGHAEYLRHYSRLPERERPRFSPGPVRQDVLGMEGVLEKAMVCIDHGSVHLFRRTS